MARCQLPPADGTQRNRALAPYMVAGVFLLVVGVMAFGSTNHSMQLAFTTASLRNLGRLGSHGAASTVSAKPWPGATPMELPSQATFDRLQADPALVDGDARMLDEFEAAPWLLPPRTQALRYAGVHDLDTLLAMRAARKRSYNRTIAVLTFTAQFAALMQNTIYSMVKFGGVTNYIVGTWAPADLAACADMNLPCADITAFLPQPLERPAELAVFGTKDYLTICWLRPKLVLHLLQKGFVVLHSDGDIVYTLKPAWDSYLAFLANGKADAAFQVEYGSVNGGNYVVLPTPNAITLFKAWAGNASDGIRKDWHDQQGIDDLNTKAWLRCTSAGSCNHARREMAAKNESGLALVRAYLPGFFMYHDDFCALSRVEDMPLLDTCDWTTLHFHPICSSPDVKLAFMRRQGLWFMDDAKCAPRPGQLTNVSACQLARWRNPDYELHLYSCPAYGLALEHERQVGQPPPLAAEAAPAGSDTEAAVSASDFAPGALADMQPAQLLEAAQKAAAAAKEAASRAEESAAAARQAVKRSQGGAGSGATHVQQAPNPPGTKE